MFIKLTRLDNSPIWLNAAFIVTVEPRKGGGTIVVPIGDGLDYEVRETAEAVLGMLGDAPMPTVVPVPAPKGLTKTPDDVSPDRGMPDLLPERPVPAKPVSPVQAEPPAPSAAPVASEAAEVQKKSADESAKVEAPAAAASAEEPEPAKPVKRTRKTAVKTKTAAKPRKKAAAKKEPAPAPKPMTPLVLDEGQVERLKKMSPRSIRKLANTLMAQFKVGDPFEVIRALEEREFLKTEGDRVLWPVVAAEPEKTAAKE